MPCVASRVEWNERPGPDQGLVNHILIDPVRGKRALDLDLEFAVEPAPAVERGAPLGGNLAEHADPGANVFRTLGVVRGRGQHRPRPGAPSRPVLAMELVNADPEPAWIAAHLVERGQPVEAVEGGVLKPLR